MFSSLLANINKHLFAIFAVIFLMLSPVVYADQTKLTDRPDVQVFIKQTAKTYGFTESYLKNILDQAEFIPSVITKMQHPYEAKPWTYYHNFFITPERVADGVNFYNKHQSVLEEVEKTYGVPANIIVAIIGVETRYGQIMGQYRVLDSLTTLAFNYSPRAPFFRQELAKFFVLARENKLDPLTIYGSRSGAVGLCQFMPSSYLFYGVNYADHSKPPNLFNNPEDAIASTANFLRQNHWQPNKPITSPADIIGSRYMRLVKQNSRVLQEPKITLSTFANYGVKPAGMYHQDD